MGATKADRKTRRPEWNQNFLIRSDLAEPDPPPDDDASNMDDGEDACHDLHGSSGSDGVTACSASKVTAAAGWIGSGRTPAGACGSCVACRRRKIEVVLEVWDQYSRDGEEEEGNEAGRRPSTSKPNDIFGECGWGSLLAVGCYVRWGCCAGCWREVSAVGALLWARGWLTYSSMVAL